MKRVYTIGMIGFAAVALLSLIEAKSFSSNAWVELTRIQTSPEVPGGRYPGSENQVLLKFNWVQGMPGGAFGEFKAVWPGAPDPSR